MGHILLAVHRKALQCLECFRELWAGYLIVFLLVSGIQTDGYGVDQALEPVSSGRSMDQIR